LGAGLGPPLHESAKKQSVHQFKHVSFGAAAVSWVRYGKSKTNSSITSRAIAGSASSAACSFRAVTRSPLLAIGHAGGATAGANRTWLLTDYTSRAHAGCVLAPPLGQRTMESNVTAGFLGLAVESPAHSPARLFEIDQLPAGQLADAASICSRSRRRIARTVAILFSVSVGDPFRVGIAAHGGAAPACYGAGRRHYLVPAAAGLIEAAPWCSISTRCLLAWLPTALLAAVTLALLLGPRWRFLPARVR